MRHEVSQPSNNALNRLSARFLALLLMGTLMGCQLTQPIRLPPASALKPPAGQVAQQQPTENATSPTTPVLGAEATIRGQSGDGWSTTAGSDNTYRSPMVPTDTTQSVNRYTSTQSGNGLPAPNSTASPSTTVLQPPVPPPAGNPGLGNPANGTQGFGGPSYQAPGYGTPNYGAPAYTAPTGNTVPNYSAPAYSLPTGNTVPNYGAPGYNVPSPYESAIAPSTNPGLTGPQATLAPGAYGGYSSDPLTGFDVPNITAPGGYQPRTRVAPLDVYLQEGRTGRIVLGGSVNSDLGVAGQVVIDERNFDFRALPRSWQDLWGGRAFRGGGQSFRAELMPGNRVERYTVSWSTPNLRGYLPYSLSVGGFYYTRQFRDWTEQRIGGRVALGYAVTKDLSVSSEIRLEDVKLFDPRIAGVQELDSALGSNDLYTARFRIVHDTRDSPFMATDGSMLELVYDQVFGEYDYPRGQINYSRYFRVHERADGGGRHVLASTWKTGFSGSQTPIFENFFAGGYSTMRGFSFRGASPKVGDVQVGGEFMFLGSLEYIFPLTADEMLRGVAFVDYGTVEQKIELNSDSFRVAPGLGLRVTVPALGPAPLAFDFAYPINHADTDDRQVFSFFMGFTR